MYWSLLTALVFAAPQERVAASGPAFVANRGQWPEHVLFLAEMPGMVVHVERDAIGLVLAPGDAAARSRAYLRLVFEGAGAPSLLEALDERPGRYSWFRGNDPERWIADVPSFGGVRWRDLAPGIDLELRLVEGGPKYDILVEPGADLAGLAVRCEGAEALVLEPDGSLVLASAAGALRQAGGKTWEVLPDGSRRPLLARHVLHAGSRFGFEVSGRDPNLALVIDPELRWSTFLGTSTPGSGDHCTAVDVDRRNGDVVVTGRKIGLDFPTTPGALQLPGNGPESGDPFVTRFRGIDGELLLSSLIGGSHPDDRPWAVSVDRFGRPTIAGLTNSLDFPVTPGAFDTTKDNGTFVGFVLRLDADQTTLDFSSFLESSWGLNVNTVGTDPESGAAIVAGHTIAGHPTTPGSFQPDFQGGGDAFVTKFTPDGSALDWSTYLGGSMNPFGSSANNDEIFDLVVDRAGHVIVAGTTSAVDFPVTPGAFMDTWPGLASPCGFLTKLDRTGAFLRWSTLIGGSGLGKASHAEGVSIAADGSVLACGSTTTLDFPTTPGAYQEFNPGGPAGWAVRLAPDGASLVYGTLLKWEHHVVPRRIRSDPSGLAALVGRIDGQVSLPAGGFDTIHNLGPDGLALVLNPSGTKLLYASFLGGGGWDAFLGLALDPRRGVVMAGGTAGMGFPTTPGALLEVYPGGQGSGFVTVLDPYLAGTQPFGEATAGCLGPPHAGTSEMPVAGAAGFSVYCSGAPPHAEGWLLFGARAASPWMLAGAELFLEPATIGRIPVQADADGWIDLVRPIPAAAQGARISVQFLLREPATCPGGAPWSASQALELTVQ